MKTCIVNILVFFITVSLLCSCQREELPQAGDTVPEGYMALSFKFSAPDQIKLDTKAADPDGKGINKMTLFCFDNFGMFVSYVNDVQITPDNTNLSNGYSVSGSVNSVLVPENTRRLHFVANQNTTGFTEDDFKGKNERDVISVLEGSSGMVVYWGYFSASGPEITDADKFLEALQQAHGPNGKPIRMLRNQAVIEVPTNSRFTVSGFTVINTTAFGTVAPYHPTKGFNFTTFTTTDANGTEKWNDCDWTNTDFITLPENTTRITPPADVDIAPETIVFETDNKSSDPVSVIIKGKNAGESAEKYYRVILMDNDGNYIKIRRNFRYTVNITGKLNYGQNSFEEALSAPASNNIWLSINDEVKDISDNVYNLKVDETTIELLATPYTDDGGNIKWTLSKPDKNALFDLVEPYNHESYYELDMGYYLSRTNGSSTTAQDAPVIGWADGCEISSVDPINDFIPAGHNNYSEATVILDNLGGLETKQSITGTVVITKGLLQRKIKITILKTLYFVPVWVSTQVNMSAGENLTLLFTVPDECPDELLPFDVYISAQHVDIRSASGQQLPIITYRSNPVEYGNDTYSNQSDLTNNKPIGYKYVYTVTQKGDQRVYFSNLLHRESNNLNEWITIESPFFETVKKTIVFNNSAEYRIEMPVLSVYVPNGTVPDNTYAYDEEIKYLLVAPKKNAAVDLGLVFKHKNGNNWDNVKASVNDEFFIYSEFLSHLNGHGETNACNCQFEDFHTELWGSGGRIHAFKFDNVNNMNYPEGENTTKTGYLIHMITDTPYSEEVVRISSNQPGSEQAFKATGETATYGNESSGEKGRGYRSLIFELSNYHPFHFGAKIGESGKNETEGTIVTGGNEEVVDNFSLDYGPNGNIDIYLNITSYIGADNRSVDPFGTEFYVYIIAPMLEIGSLTAQQAASGKLIEIKDGLFAYKVEKTETGENSSPFSVTGNPTLKKIPFAKKSAITKGEITITTDPKVAGTTGITNYNEHIVAYYNKTFKLENKPISGTIKTTEGQMKDGAFVAFSITRNDSRIGSMRVFVENGVSKYELTLRPEYDFTWDEEIKITHTHIDGTVNEVFEKTISGGLAALQSSPDIVLEKKN